MTLTEIERKIKALEKFKCKITYIKIKYHDTSALKINHEHS
jgi:hypothetical protein